LTVWRGWHRHKSRNVDITCHRPNHAIVEIIRWTVTEQIARYDGEDTLLLTVHVRLCAS